MECAIHTQDECGQNDQTGVVVSTSIVAKVRMENKGSIISLNL